MLLLVPPLLALCWVCLCQRRSAVLTTVRVRGKKIVVAALLIEYGVAHLATPGWGAALYTGLAGIFLILFLSLNWRLPGIPVVALGISLNLAVMIANGGFMPMSVKTALAVGYHPGIVTIIGHPLAGSKDVLLHRSEQHLAFLRDHLVLPPAFGVLSQTAYSIGDAVLSLGLAVVVLLLGRSAQPGQRDGNKGAIKVLGLSDLKGSCAWLRESMLAKRMSSLRLYPLRRERVGVVTQDSARAG
jgi:hypothetical protein